MDRRRFLQSAVASLGLSFVDLPVRARPAVPEQPGAEPAPDGVANASFEADIQVQRSGMFGFHMPLQPNSDVLLRVLPVGDGLVHMYGLRTFVGPDQVLITDLADMREFEPLIHDGPIDFAFFNTDDCYCPIDLIGDKNYPILFQLQTQRSPVVLSLVLYVDFGVAPHCPTPAWYEVPKR